MKSRYEVRNPFTYDAAAVSRETALECLDESKTVQSQKKDADINTIVERFGLTGQLPENVRMPVPEDYTDVSMVQMDYHSAVNYVRDTEQAFMQFPVEVRRRFGHNPHNMTEFLMDSANRDEAVRLGLVVPPQAASAASPSPDASAASPSGEG